MVEQDAAPAGVPRKARTRAAPGLRLGANRSRPPGAGWRMAVCCPEASSARRRKRQQGEGSQESKRDGQRKARPGAARKTPWWRAGRRPVFSRGNTGT